MSKDMRHLTYKCCVGLEACLSLIAESFVIMKYERKLHEYVRNHFQICVYGEKKTHVYYLLGPWVRVIYHRNAKFYFLKKKTETLYFRFRVVALTARSVQNIHVQSGAKLKSTK